MLEFERPILELEKKLKDLRDLAHSQSVDLGAEIKGVEKKLISLLQETYSQLTPWQKVQVSRHPNRPYTKDYIDALFTDFQELHGDRSFGDDAAIIGGTALFRGTPVMVIGHQKGRKTKEKMERNFGMARPEGYRKVIRLLELASRFRLPLIHFIDTPGAYPGLDAEERGQAEAIADCIRHLFVLETPTLAIVIGEGGSGGALALSATDEVQMLEFSTYSVISPESCASILWNDSTLAERAAERIKLTSHDLLRFGIIDSVIPEPLGGAHRNWEECFRLVGDIIETYQKKSEKIISSEVSIAEMLETRYQRYRTLGQNQISFLNEENFNFGASAAQGASVKRGKPPVKSGGKSSVKTAAAKTKPSPKKAMTSTAAALGKTAMKAGAGKKVGRSDSASSKGRRA